MEENRELFFNRLQPFHAPSTITKIELAYTLSKWGHHYQMRTQKDKDGNNIRYFEHPRSVAIILMDELNIFDYEMVVSALMHDIFEDSRHINPPMVEQFFGTDVCKIIKTLTKEPKEGYIDRFLICKDYRPFIIKACDRLDNLRSLDDCSKEFKIKQVKETKEKYFQIFEKMINISPDEYKESCKNIRDKIREIIAKHEALL